MIYKETSFKKGDRFMARYKRTIVNYAAVTALRGVFTVGGANEVILV